MDWSKYHPYFKASEFSCKETGEHGIKKELLDHLLALRIEWNKPMTITSGFRSVRHSREVKKQRPGPHTTGLSCDIAIGPGAEVWEFVEMAMRHGFTGIGISQKAGLPRFVHIDLLDKRMWSY